MSAWKTKATKGGGGDFEKAPPGNHPAVLVAMIDLGTQENEFGGEVKEQHRLFWIWELVTEKTKAGLNHLIGMDLTFSLNEKAKMRGFIEARLARPLADSEEYDVSGELGQPCLLNVVEKNGYPKVNGVTAIPKGMTVAQPSHPVFTWTMDDFRATGKIDLPGWVPYLYGEPLAAHIERALDFPKDAVADALEKNARQVPDKSAGAPSNRPAPPSGRPTPPSQPIATSTLRLWLDLGNGQMNDEPLAVDDAGVFLASKGLKDDTLASADGTEWKPASSFGVKLPY